MQQKLCFSQQQPEDISIATGEDTEPMSILMDEKCEELAHPFLFPTGKFGYKVKQDLSVMLQLNLNSQLNIAMKKVCTTQLTAGMLSNNFSGTVKSFIAKDEGFNFMNSVKGTPAYWKKFQF